MISQDRESYQQFKNSFKNKLPRLHKIQKNNKRSIIVMGDNGSGKSALISYLLKAHMFYQKKLGRFQINNAFYSDKYPKIVHNLTSQQLNPSSFELNQEEKLIQWSFQYMGEIKEIINAFQNQVIFQKGKQIKIVVVIEINGAMASKGNLLIDFFHKINQLFDGNLNQMLNSMLLVFSKTDINEWTKQQISGQLLKICQLNQNMDSRTKIILQFLVKNDKIAIFPRPDRITNQIDIINQKIRQVQPVILNKKIKQTMSGRAKIIFNKFMFFLETQLKDLSQKIVQQLKTKFQSLQYQSQDEIMHVINELKRAKQILRVQFAHFQSIQALQNSFFNLKNIASLSQQRLNDMKTQSAFIIFFSKIDSNFKFKTELIQTQIQRQIEKLNQQKYALKFQRFHQSSMNQCKQLCERMMQEQNLYQEQLIRNMRR